MSPQRGPDLPYSVVAGVTPWRGGWVASSAKVHGATVGPEPPKVYETFLDVLGERPAFAIIVINAPVGYVDLPSEGARACDQEARMLLGRRGAVIRNAPSRAVLNGEVSWFEGGLDVVSATLLPRYQEVAAEMSPFRQRVIYEGNPEMSFYQLNQDNPLVRSKKIEVGREERRSLLAGKMPGLESSLDIELDHVPQKHLYDAAALLWTARRVNGHSARRIPSDPHWDSEGLRMEIVF